MFGTRSFCVCFVVLFVSVNAAVCHGKECVRFLFMLQSGVGGGKQ